MIADDNLFRLHNYRINVILLIRDYLREIVTTYILPFEVAKKKSSSPADFSFKETSHLNSLWGGGGYFNTVICEYYIMCKMIPKGYYERNNYDYAYFSFSDTVGW